MGLSTHVLDTMHGRPAARRMQVSLYYHTRRVRHIWLKASNLNADGRNRQVLL
jgi:5-hydroxyisourate hydrolase-like protein (transthyretin family)